MEIVKFFQDVKIPMTVVHVISIVFGMGAALSSDILFSFFSKDKKLNTTEIKVLSILAKIVFYGLVIILLSGTALYLSDIARYSNASKFQAKMTILLVLLLNGYFLNTFIWPHLLMKKFFTLASERNVRRFAFVSGAVSIISWLSVCALGVLDSLAMSYTAIISIYLAIILFGAVVSLWMEKKELN